MYEYPESLVAVSPRKPPRVVFKQKSHDPKEIDFKSIVDIFDEGDLLIINKTQVLPRRIFVDDFDILFLETQDRLEWKVLFPAKKFKVGDKLKLPGGITITLKEKGRPQIVSCEQVLDDAYFEGHGSFALPPYIQQARGQNRPLKDDLLWYQTEWAQSPGSLAAPTASLHFSNEDLDSFRSKINIAEVTLHVGLGTFLPITSEDLDFHEMHSEFVEIDQSTLNLISKTRNEGKKVWALGTTALRALESYAREMLDKDEQGRVFGQTDLFIKPGDEFKICDGLLTNFHQPGSTLICLVSAMAGHREVMSTYHWAIEREFRLFSYGDLSIWTK